MMFIHVVMRVVVKMMIEMMNECFVFLCMYFFFICYFINDWLSFVQYLACLFFSKFKVNF